MICLQMNAAAFVQMNEDILHWIQIGWYVGCQRYVLYTVYITRYVCIYIYLYMVHPPFQNDPGNESQKRWQTLANTMENVTSGGPWGGTRIAATSTLNRGPIRSCHLHSCSPCQCHHLHLSFRLRCGQFLERDVISISSFPPLVFECHQIVEIVVFKITDFEGWQSESFVASMEKNPGFQWWTPVPVFPVPWVMPPNSRRCGVSHIMIFHRLLSWHLFRLGSGKEMTRNERTRTISLFTWNLFVLYFGVSTLQNKVFSNQNKGHLGSRYLMFPGSIMMIIRKSLTIIFLGAMFIMILVAMNTHHNRDEWENQLTCSCIINTTCQHQYYLDGWL